MCGRRRGAESDVCECLLLPFLPLQQVKYTACGFDKVGKSGGRGDGWVWPVVVGRLVGSSAQRGSAAVKGPLQSTFILASLFSGGRSNKKCPHYSRRESALAISTSSFVFGCLTWRWERERRGER